MSDENEVPPYEDLLASLSDQVSHLAYGGDPDDTGQRQIPAAEVIEWAVNELKRLRAEIARLRITDAEREAIERLCEATNDMIANDKRAGGCFWQDDAAAVAAARGLLERLGGAE